MLNVFLILYGSAMLLCTMLIVVMEYQISDDEVHWALPFWTLTFSLLWPFLVGSALLDLAVWARWRYLRRG